MKILHWMIQEDQVLGVDTLHLFDQSKFLSQSLVGNNKNIEEEKDDC